MKPATKAELAATCTASDPIEIGKSTARDVSGPGVAIGASPQGAVAAWLSSDTEVTTLPLDASGKARGEARTIASSAHSTYPRIWELGDGIFVLGLGVTPAAGQLRPTRGLQRVDASGEHVGARLTFELQDIDDVIMTDEGMRILTGWRTSRELLSVSPASDGLKLTKTKLEDAPRPDGKIGIRERMLMTDDGKLRVVTEFYGAKRVVDYEGGKRVTLDLPERFQYGIPRLDADGDVVWQRCRGNEPAQLLTLKDGKQVETEVDNSICKWTPSWFVSGDSSDYTGKNKGLAFKVTGRKPLKLSHEVRRYWNAAGAWTGKSVLAIYANGPRHKWTVVVRVITCGHRP